MRVRSNPRHAKKSFKHVGIVYDWLAWWYGISHLLAGSFGKVYSGKWRVEVKCQFPEVSWMTVRHTCMLLGISKAEFKLETCPIKVQNILRVQCFIRREIQLSFISSLLHRIPYSQIYKTSERFVICFQTVKSSLVYRVLGTSWDVQILK